MKQTISDILDEQCGGMHDVHFYNKDNRKLLPLEIKQLDFDIQHALFSEKISIIEKGKALRIMKITINSKGI